MKNGTVTVYICYFHAAHGWAVDEVQATVTPKLYRMEERHEGFRYGNTHRKRDPFPPGVGLSRADAVSSRAAELSKALLAAHLARGKASDRQEEFAEWRATQ
jgi:hypothetical protein